VAVAPGHAGPFVECRITVRFDEPFDIATWAQTLDKSAIRVQPLLVSRKPRRLGGPQPFFRLG
jgi:hypothetical protein